MTCLRPPEVELAETTLEQMDCSFRHVCSGRSHPQPIVDVYMGGYISTAMVDSEYAQYIIYASALPLWLSTPTGKTTVFCMHGIPTTYRQKRLWVTVGGKMCEMPIEISKELPCPIILGWD